MNKVKPTRLQKATLEILKENPKISPAEAMVKAGYDPTTALNAKQNFVVARGTIVATKKWREGLRGRGINENWLLDKYWEWGNATYQSKRGPVPNYKVQLGVKDDIRRDLGLPTGDKQNQGRDQKIINMFGGQSWNYDLPTDDRK